MINNDLSTDKNNGQKEQKKEPTTLFQLLVHILKNFIKGIPSRLIWAIITGLVIFVIHTYLLVVVNEGFRANENSLLKYILVLNRNIYSNNLSLGGGFYAILFWALLPVVFWGIIGQIRHSGLKGFIKNFGRNSLELFLEIFEKPGSFLLTLFLGAICIGILFGILIANPFIALLLSIIIFLSMCSRGNSFILLASYLSWSDFQRFFRINPKKAFYIDIVAMIYRGISFGLFIFCLFPFAKVANIFQYVILAIFFSLFLLNIVFRKDKKAASFLLFFGGSFFLSSIKVHADDGGWSESGGNFFSWIASEGSFEAMIRGTGPALGAISFALGFVPVLGDIKDVQEAATGKDYITGEKLDAIERALTIIGVAIPVVSGKLLRDSYKVGKNVVEAVDNASPKAFGFFDKVQHDALKLQGYSDDEAAKLMEQFAKGINPDNKFAFHFTKPKAAEGILESGYLKGGTVNLRGKGVYAGTVPNPSFILKYVPFIGWGIGNCPVRIPIRLEDGMNIDKVVWPMKTVIIREDIVPLVRE